MQVVFKKSDNETNERTTALGTGRYRSKKTFSPDDDKTMNLRWKNLGFIKRKIIYRQR